jgi:hypothetical protein
MKETALVTQIINFWKKKGAKVQKNHGTAFARAGTPDLFILYQGIFSAQEVKAPGKNEGLEYLEKRREHLYENEPTPAQHYQLLEWQKRGARVGVARSVEDSWRIMGLK